MLFLAYAKGENMHRKPEIFDDLQSYWGQFTQSCLCVAAERGVASSSCRRAPVPIPDLGHAGRLRARNKLRDQCGMDAPKVRQSSTAVSSTVI